MNNQKPRWSDALRYLVVLSLSALFWLSVPSKAQTSQQGTSAGDSDVTRWQLESMDHFLDGHPEIAEQLRRNPALINNDEFVENHPALREFLQQHPGVREEFTESPRSFMRQEERFDRREDEHRGAFGDSDTTRWQVSRMDEFLDNHREIAEQLRRNPSLIQNEQFLNSHPELHEFLQQHPGIREEFTENPQAFMHQEERFDRHEGEEGFRDRDTDRSQIARMDRFLDRHPEIDEQLRKDPSLIRNEQFVQSHPALQEFLQQHPEIREEFAENPQAFMRREERYDRHEDRWDHNGDRDDMRGQAADFGQFLHIHAIISQQLSKDPSLINNKEFLAAHSELRDYLAAHPTVQKQLTENPQGFMSMVPSGDTTGGKTMTPKPPKSQ